MNHRKIDHAKEMRIQRLLREGFSMRKVARVVGVQFKTVARYKRVLETAKAS